jgi:hypothetical protein
MPPHTRSRVGRGTTSAPALLEATARSSITLVEGGAVVRKQYEDEIPERALWAARSEYARQQALWEALSQSDGVSCPRPLSLSLGYPPAIRMEARPGLPLHQHLAGRTGFDHLIVLADRLAAGLLTFVRVCGGPYLDFCPQNVLVGPGARIVLLDFGPPRRQNPKVLWLDPFDVSLGNFVGWTAYEAARPASVARPPRALEALTHMVLERVGGEASGWSIDGVREMARLTFRRLAYLGGLPRQMWYRTAGRALSEASISRTLSRNHVRRDR